MKKRLIMCTNNIYVAEVIMVNILVWSLWIWFVIDQTDPWTLRFLFVLMSFNDIVILASCHIAVGWLVFTDEGIRYYAVFKKTEFRPYSFYTHVDYAAYFTHNFGINHIVFSDHYLDKNLRFQINRAASNVEFVKIRVNAKKLQKLMAILPPSHQFKLRAAVQAQENLFAHPVHHKKRKKYKHKK